MPLKSDAGMPSAVQEVEVNYGETVSVGDFSNVRVDVRYVARDEKWKVGGVDVEGRITDPEALRDEMLASARAAVQEEIDNALEANGRPPKYYSGPLYKLISSDELRIVAVVPQDMLMPVGFQYAKTFDTMNLRYEKAMKYGQQEADFHRFIFHMIRKVGDGYPWEKDEEEL